MPNQTKSRFFKCNLRVTKSLFWFIVMFLGQWKTVNAMTIFSQTDNADIDNVNLDAILPLATPAELKTALPLTEKAYQTVLKGRETVKNILNGTDKRLLMVIGLVPFTISKPAMNMPINWQCLPKKLKIPFISSCVCILKNHAPPWVGKV